MHTSLNLNDRSPGGHDSSAPGSSGQHYRGSRGFGYRKRGYNIRGRGGSYHRGTGSWYNRTTVKEEPQGDVLAQSLLSRLEQSSDSLLSRLSPGKELGPGGPNLSGEQRVGNGGSGSDGGKSDSIASSRNPSPRRPSMHDLTAEELIASALEQGKQQLMEQRCLNERRSRSPASEAAVDDLLAADEEEEDIRSSTPIPDKSSKSTTSTTAEPAIAPTASGSQSVDRTSVVEQARKLFIPVIIQNARLRNPEMDPEELEKKVVSLVTDEQCLAFVKFAQEARSQAKGKEGVGEKKGSPTLDSFATLLGGRGAVQSSQNQEGSRKSGERAQNKYVADKLESGTGAREAGSSTTPWSSDDPSTKRQREPTTEGESLARPSKVLRRTTLDGSTSSTNSEVPHNGPRAASVDGARPSPSASPSKLLKEPPKAPKAMRGLGMAHSLSASSTGSRSSSPEKPSANTKGKTVEMTNPPTGQQTVGHTDSTTGTVAPKSSTPRPAALLSVTPMSRVPSASSDMDIDDDATPSPRKPSPATHNLRQDDSSPPAPVIHVSLLTPEVLVSTQTMDVERTSTNLASSAPAGPSGDVNLALPVEYSSAGPSESRVGDSAPLVAIRQPSLDRSAPSHVAPEGPSAVQSPSAPSEPPVPESTNMAYKPEPSTAPADSSLLNSGQEERDMPTGLTQNMDYTIKDSVSEVHRSEVRQSDGSGFAGVSAEGQSSGDMDQAPIGEAANKEASSNAIPSRAQIPVQSRSVPMASFTPEVKAQESAQMDVDSDHATPALRDAPSVAPLSDQPLPSSTNTSDLSPGGAPVAQAIDALGVSMTDVHMADHTQSPLPTEATSQEQTSVKVVGIPSQTTEPAVAVESSSETSEIPRLSLPCLCFAEVGKAGPQVSTLTFNVDPESAAAARRWSQRDVNFDPSASYVMFRLLCLQTADVERAAAENPAASPEEFASTLWCIRTKWPRCGQLLLEVNGETESRGSWIPKHLGPEDGPVDLTPHVISGNNFVRVIQLAAQTDRIFVVYAGHPPEAEVKQYTNTANWSRFASQT